MTDRELLQQALDALVQARKLRFALWRNGCDCEGEHTCDPLKDSYAKQFNDAIIAIEDARLAQPEQEPVAWMHIHGSHEDPCFRELDEDEIRRGWTQKPLYTAPPQREWQGLTDKEQLEIMKQFGPGQRGLFADAIEAKLKEKNFG